MRAVGRMLVGVIAVIGPGLAQPASADPYMFGFSGGDSCSGLQSLYINGVEYRTCDSQIDSGVDNQGWWSATNSNSDGNDNYFVGDVSLDGSQLLNNFFTFDLSNFTGGATSAELRLARYVTTGPLPLLYSLFDVSTDYLILNSNDGTNAGIFDDLGSGILYGSIVVSDLSLPDPLIITLNAAALADINIAAGGVFSIGGTLTPTQVPEPAFVSLFAIGACALAIRARRRRALR
jgi:hypothetical protein